MAISVADNFSYKGAKPLDARVTYDTVADMKATVENTLYDGCMAYVKATKKYYTFDSSNETDVTLGRWRELETGTSITIDSTPTEGSDNAVSSGGVYDALDDKVDKVSGKGLSTEDYTTAEKTKLSGINANAEENTIESITVNGDEVTPDANKNIALTIITNTVNNLLNYYLKSETYSKSEVDTLISAVQGASFESVSVLPTTDIKTNVIYLVPKTTPETNNVKDEYINLDGTTAGWEHIGDTSVDLSGYVTTQALNTALADYTTTADLTTLLSGKVDKVTGKGLSTNDYTDAEKTKLAGLSNYDDTAISGRVSDIEDVVPSTASTSNKLVTMSDVGGATGHIIEDATGVDMTDRGNLQFIGATVTDDSENDRTIVTINDPSGKADKVANATDGNIAGLDEYGNLTDSNIPATDIVTTSETAGLLKNDGTVDETEYISDVSDKEDKFRYATMPEASAEAVALGIVQYTGATLTNSFRHGMFYECKAQGTDPETYAWEEVSNVKELTQAEYNTLSTNDRNNGTVYLISDKRTILCRGVNYSSDRQIIDVEEPEVTIGTYTYDGTAQGPTIVSRDTEHTTVTNATNTDAGTYSMTIELNNTGTMMWEDGTTLPRHYTYTIDKAEQSFTVDTQQVQVTLDEPNYTANATIISGEGAITAESLDLTVARVVVDGTEIKITGSGEGSTDIVVKMAETTNYAESTSVSIRVIASALKIVSWAEGTDEEIVALIDAADKGKIDLYQDCGWRPGDVRTIHIGQTSNYFYPSIKYAASDIRFVLADVGDAYEFTSPVPNGRTHSSFVVMTIDIPKWNNQFQLDYYSSESVVKPWNAYARRTLANSDFYNAIPSTIRNIFKSVKVKTQVANDINGSIVTDDYVFFPSGIEMGVRHQQGYTKLLICEDDSVEFKTYSTWKVLENNYFIYDSVAGSDKPTRSPCSYLYGSTYYDTEKCLFMGSAPQNIKGFTNPSTTKVAPVYALCI